MDKKKPRSPKKNVSQMDRFSGTNEFNPNIGITQKVSPGTGSGSRVTRKLSDGSYGTTVQPDTKKTVRSGKNLLGRQVVKTKTASFGAVKKNPGTDKEKTIGDKTITKNKTVFKKGGGGIARSKSVTRAATSTKKGIKEAKGAMGQGSGESLGVTGTNSDFKRRLFKSRVIKRS